MNDEISAPVRDIAKRFSLTDDQSHVFETEATLLVAGMTDLESFKDNLIAEVGVDYETAVRIKRAIENEVVQPILDEIAVLDENDQT